MKREELLKALKSLTVEASLESAGRYDSGPKLVLTVKLGEDEISKTEETLYWSDLREPRDGY